MKKILMTAAAVAMLAAPAFAQDASSTVTVGGSVAPACGNGNQSGGGIEAPTTNVALGEMADSNGFLSVAEQTINFGNTWCNAAATVDLDVSQLTNSATNTDPSSFVGALDMVLTKLGNGKGILVYVGDPAEVRSGDEVVTASPGAFETGTNDYASALLNVTLPEGTAGNDRPLAGTWSGSIVFTASAN